MTKELCRQSYLLGMADGMESKWIKVTDRMPDEDGRYLIVESILYVWVGVCSFRQGRWDSPTVTHWMPLPEKPI